MKIYNTLTRNKDELKSIEEKKLRIYACGPTVYNFIHIGNARPLCVFDVLRRYLSYMGYEVNFVQNFTDVDDKIINKANEEGTSSEEIAKRYIAEFWTDAKGLNIMEATTHPKATENIDAIIDLITKLENNGYAYKASNGDVYFRAKKFSEYGKLSHQPLEDLEAGARIEVNDIKEDAMDFCLWKSAKPGEPFWESPWSDGRPGWHIECSAMAGKYLGDTIDIHCGGQDLIFPHHENEIAQSECANNCEFSHYWMHNGYINVDNKKMSKSKGNFFTVREVSQVYGYEPIRYLMISSHYRSPINYSTDIIEQCKSSLERLYTCRHNLQFAIDNCTIADGKIPHFISARKDEFLEALSDDLNTADALGVLFSFVKDINIYINAAPNNKALEEALTTFNDLCGILGILYDNSDDLLDEDIEKLIEERNQARKNRDFATADKIRDDLKVKGIILEDTPQGVKYHKA